jgi:hypothetical protein
MLLRGEFVSFKVLYEVKLGKSAKDESPIQIHGSFAA